MTDEAKTPGTDAAADGETLPIIDFFADMPGIGEHVKDAYQKQQNRLGADAEDKTPANEGFADKIRQIIEDDKDETSPDSAADPWAGEDSTLAEVPLTPPREFYENIPIKEIPELDTYEELVTHWYAVAKEVNDLQEERNSKEVVEEQIEDLRDIAEDLKDTNFLGRSLAGAAEHAAEELEAESERPPVDLSTNVEIRKEGLIPDPDVVTKYRDVPTLDTYEELEADYKDQLWQRDQELMKTYESQQREAVEDAVEDVGEAAADFVKDHPALGDFLQGAVEQAEVDEQSATGPVVEPPGSESARDGGALDYLRNLGGTTEDDELEAEKQSATERVEPPGSGVAPIEGDTSSRLIGGEALPTDALRDETFSGEEEGGGAPEATGAPDEATAAPATTTDGAKIEMPPDSVEQAGADVAAVGEAGAAIGAETAGEAGGPGETTIKDTTGEAILVDPPGAAGDVVEHMDDPAANALLEDGVEPPPFMEDTFEEGGLGDNDVGNEDVVEHMDDPIF